MTSENYFQRQLFSAQTKFWRVDSDNYFPAQHICASLCLMRRAHRVEVCGGAGGARQHHHKSLPHPSTSTSTSLPFSRTHRPPALTPRRFSPTIAAGSRIGLVERPCRFKPTSFDPVCAEGVAAGDLYTLSSSPNMSTPGCTRICSTTRSGTRRRSVLSVAGHVQAAARPLSRADCGCGHGDCRPSRYGGCERCGVQRAHGPFHPWCVLPAKSPKTVLDSDRRPPGIVGKNP